MKVNVRYLGQTYGWGWGGGSSPILICSVSAVWGVIVFISQQGGGGG